MKLRCVVNWGGGGGGEVDVPILSPGGLQWS